ncbi:MAG: PEP-CTERM sorting domain-containing protein [Planctomycetes bacterium]|nr:PEP-CTERM sorting domain-containing protein [Planctomycetota bacterium]
MKRALGLGFGLALTSSAFAGFVAGPAAGPFNSDGGDNNAANGIMSWGYAGAAFNTNQIVIDGDVTYGGTGSYRSELRVRVVGPGGGTATTGSFVSGTTWAGTIHVNAVVNLSGTITGGPGTWNFRFWESYDDPGVDAIWSNVTITVNDSLPPDTNQTIAVGALPSDGTLVSYAGDLRSAGLVDRYDFSLPYAVANINDYLNTRTSGGTTNFDTQLGLFDLSTGLCVATNDDGGVGLASNLTFGSNDPYNEDTPDGFDGASLAAGNYALLVGGYSTNFAIGQAIGDVVGGSATGNYTVSFNYVPEPASLVLLALGGLALIRRR